MDDVFDALLRPKHLFSRAEVMATPSPVPRSGGIYAWYFNSMPPGVDGEPCHEVSGNRLLYTGISPASAASRQTLNKRIRAHYGNANASASTLRLTLGVLLSDELGIALQRANERHTFGVDGETRLSMWMGDHARVCWYQTPEPWLLEPAVISEVDVPLNLRGNDAHPFHALLSARRSLARALARRIS